MICWFCKKNETDHPEGICDECHKKGEPENTWSKSFDAALQWMDIYFKKSGEVE